MTRRAHPSLGETLQGLAALAGLGVLTAGVPAALWWAVGWPLPHQVPSFDQLTGALTRTSIPDAFFPKALAVLAWLAWAQFLTCLWVEVRAALNGRVPGRVPLGGRSQALAARLVGALLLLSPGGTLTRPALASLPPATPAVRAYLPAAHTPPVLAPPPASAPAAPSTPPAPARPSGQQASEEPVYVVKPRDTLWGIARAHLRDEAGQPAPRRWPEIAKLNLGRAQPDGRRFTNPHRIYPGWRLRLPPDAVGLPRPAAPHPRTDPEPALPPPASPASPPATTPPPAATTRPPPSGNGTVPGTPAQQDPPDQVTVPPGVLTGVGAGLLAAGLLTVLTQLRRRQQRHRPPGRRIRLPDGAAAQVELAARLAAEPDSARFLDLALRAMASGTRRDRLPSPAVHAALLTPTTLELLLTTPAPTAPEPFSPTAEGMRWVLPRDTPIAVLEPAGSGAVAPLPALVTLGTTDQGQLLVNLEAGGTVALTGPPPHPHELLRALAVELATSPWAGFFDLVLVGFGQELAVIDRVQHTSTLEPLLPALEQHARATAQLLEAAGVGSVLTARVTGDTPDAWTPTVVLCAHPPDPATWPRLAALTSPPGAAPVTVVTAGDLPGATWHVTVTGEHAELLPLGLACRPQRLDTETYQAIGKLLATATDTSGVPPARTPPSPPKHPQPATPPAPAPQPPTAPPAEPTPTAAAPAPEPATTPPAPEPEGEPRAAVEIRLLGPVEIVAPRRVDRAKSVELLAYLALHPEGVTGDQIWEALWPERPLVPMTLHSTVAVARSRLGSAPDGTPYLPQVLDGRYRLSHQVPVDWHRFQALADQGHQPDPAGRAALTQALGLVRGVPLTAPARGGYEWALPHRAEMEAAIADAAERLALRCLDAGDHATATWAARRGLAASPYDERLYRALMRAAHAAGNPAGVDAVMDELCQLIGEDIEPYDELHPETVELYEQLRGTRQLRARRQHQSTTR